MADEQLQSKPVRIYCLLDPRTHTAHYVGKTSGTLRTRLAGHLGDVRRGRVYIPRHKWIASLGRDGIEPEIVELETVHDDVWQEAEQFWIAYLRYIGCPLLNGTAGVDGIHGHRHSEETREKQRQATLARYLAPEAKRLTGEAVRKAFQREDARENLRTAAAKRDWPRPEALIAYSKSEAGRKRLSEMSKGKPMAESTRLKLSAAKKGKKMPASFSVEQSRRMQGHRHSDDTRAKIGQAHASRRGAMAGVHLRKNRFIAKIQIGGKSRYLGMFETAEAAHAAYLNARDGRSPSA